MNQKQKITCFVLAGCFLSCLGTSLEAQETTADNRKTEAAVAAANSQFYEALNALFTGEMKPMEAVWSHANDVNYLPPMGGRLHGWEAVRGSWQEQADFKLGGRIEPHDIRIVVTSPESAVVTTTEIGNNPNTPFGPMKVNIRATKVFRKEGGEWKLIHHHADKLAQLEKTRL